MAQSKKTGAEGVKWNLTDLYSGIDDHNIEKDLKNISIKSVSFEKIYRGKIKSSKLKANELLTALKQLESLSEKTGKILSYAHLL
ncbi:MAG: M3 family oligoendopeptidase, partial [Thermodesulfobacteriota bacterium]